METTKLKTTSDLSGEKRKGKISAISVSRKKGVPKLNIPMAVLLEDYGIDGDAHAGSWHRQVSLLSVESINKMKEAGLPKLRPGIFAENITTKDINLALLYIGSRIKIGEEAELEITQIGKECHAKCAIYYKAGDCIMPREGIFAKVVTPGVIEVGDDIKILIDYDQL